MGDHSGDCSSGKFCYEDFKVIGCHSHIEKAFIFFGFLVAGEEIEIE
jgi:hypothetical protein